MYNIVAIARALSITAGDYSAYGRLFAVDLCPSKWGADIAVMNEVWNRERRGLGSTVAQAMAVVGVAASCDHRYMVNQPLHKSDANDQASDFNC
jgi:hypothetical protein